ncbi:ABC transporter ATP-binding protein [Pararhodospirillum oryzae]|uniref:ABC transporter ATP-binding protein n=1 Tax=Pararhodospirillum oryzae TaxID=478448 RepID=A0A512H404_9PROT|nr:ABC transporter ATP-binding protein [Pararhodospirillum oryzae]GEO80110.1 ABC transporter ATP-binding protein [Pararhodospirillum oryzae]
MSAVPSPVSPVSPVSPSGPAPASLGPAVSVRGLTKRFGPRVVVNGFSLDVARGEIHGFLGPNGSGKTTTLRMLCGLLHPDGGQGTCLGHDIVKDSWAIKRQVGYMTQRFSLYEDLTIRENLEFVARLHALPDRRQRVAQALDRLGLAGRRTQLAGTLSGGWKQRLALAACILHNPKLLLLDEPTAGVDPKARREFWNEIHQLAADGMTVLVSTHYMDEAERCHRIAYMAYGHLLAQGTVDEVVAASGLSTWHVEGAGATLNRLALALEGRPGVAMVAPFGATLHVSGPDGPALDQAVFQYQDQPGLAWRRDHPTLEDAFIHLMARAPDSGQGPQGKGGVS